MRDLWGFLLQTLTVSGAAVLVLVVKTLLCRQLSPRWQAGIWCLVGIVAMLPAGWGGRYVLVNWPAAVETLKAALAGDYGPLRVTMPVPLPDAAPQTVWSRWVAYVVFDCLRAAAGGTAPGKARGCGCDGGGGADSCPIRPGRLPGSGGGRDLFRIYLRSGASGFGGACRTDDG